MMSTRQFIAEYVEPSMELFRTNSTVTHLAAHAIAQIDVLAEIVALSTFCGAQGTAEERAYVREFRDDLGKRHPILAVIRDAHDSHKHGELHRKTALSVSKGQRPEAVTQAGFFAGVSFFDGPPTLYQVMVLILDDGTQKEIYQLLFDAKRAWERELA